MAFEGTTRRPFISPAKICLEELLIGTLLIESNGVDDLRGRSAGLWPYW
jgi:hypothetical protein